MSYKSLYQYLVENCLYSDADAVETVLRDELGLEIPDNVKRDIRAWVNDGIKPIVIPDDPDEIDPQDIIEHMPITTI